MDLDLNFSVAQPAPSAGKKTLSGPNKKGGKWTQRSNTKQKEKRLQQRTQPEPQSTRPSATRQAVAPSPSESSVPPFKPATQSRTSASKAGQSVKGTSSDASPKKKSETDQRDLMHNAVAATSSSSNSQHQHSQQKSFISSLFTSMPDMPAPTQHSNVPLEAGLPSNAPSQGTLASLHLFPEIISCLKSQKFDLERPTPIQASAVPALHQANPGADFILQAQTGSGKTLAYLLPIVQDLLRLGQQLTAEGNPPDRQMGTLAIVLVPTRELANQVYQVALNLLSMASNKEKTEDEEEQRQQQQGEEGDRKGRPHTWITPGLLSGGMSRQHEKARLRKGVPLLIATPGRLIDHLETTTSFHIAGEQRRRPAPKKKSNKPDNDDDDFDVEDRPFEPGADGEVSSEEEEITAHSRSYKPRKRFGADAPPPRDPRLALRWMVLDEADRLVDMGFEPQVQKVLSKLQERAERAQARSPNVSPESAKTVLCSATMQANVKKLAGQVLNSPVLVRGDPDLEAQATIQHTAPAQLAQSFAVIPPKLRLVALTALLRQTCVNQPKKTNTTAKAVVFMSCTDAVDFHWKAFGSMQMGQDAASSSSSSEEKKSGLVQRCQVLSNVPIFRLHGNLDLPTRLGSLKGFTGSTEGGILLCTSLAARGLDVPFVNSVIQYDLPTEGGLTEYLHRVGRTARAGHEGASWVFLLPSEVGWVDWAAKDTGAKFHESNVESLLKDGFGGKGKEFESRATDVQLAVERWVEAKPTHADLARNAFASHVRAYATHPGSEKHIFHRRNLHLGHLAKAFGLREAPAGLGRIAAAHKKERASQQLADSKPGQRKKRKREGEEAAGAAGGDTDDSSENADDDDEEGDSDEEGRHNGAGGRPSRPKLPRTGRGAEGRGLKPARPGQSGEFNIGSTADLEALVRRR